MCRGRPQGYPHGTFWELHVPTRCLLCCYIMVYVPAIRLWCCKFMHKFLFLCCIDTSATTTAFSPSSRHAKMSTRLSPWYILGVACTNKVFTLLLYKGLCTSNMFMVLQVVIWSYMSYKFCVFFYKFEYKNIFNKLQDSSIIVQIRYQVMYQHSASLSTVQSFTITELLSKTYHTIFILCKLSDQIFDTVRVNTTIAMNIIWIRICPVSYSRVYVNFLTCS